MHHCAKAHLFLSDQQVCVVRVYHTGKSWFEPIDCVCITQINGCDTASFFIALSTGRQVQQA